MVSVAKVVPKISFLESLNLERFCKPLCVSASTLTTRCCTNMSKQQLLTDAANFQQNIDALYNSSQKWKMLFNDNKFHAIAFGNQTSLPLYKLGNTSLEWVEETK